VVTGIGVRPASNEDRPVILCFLRSAARSSPLRTLSSILDRHSSPVLAALVGATFQDEPPALNVAALGRRIAPFGGPDSMLCSSPDVPPSKSSSPQSRVASRGRDDPANIARSSGPS